jgi:hypothetical protein
MSDHLPECNRSHPSEGYYYTADDCICSALRAAEQRGAAEAIEKYALSLDDIPDIAVYGQEKYEEGQADERDAQRVWDKIWDKGYEQGQRDAHSEFLTPAALEACGPEDPRYAKGQRDERERIRQAVEALNERLYGFVGNDWLVASQVLAVIDGSAP